MSVSVYGISNCDTVRKARNWLTQNNITHEFCDIRKTPLAPELLQSWLATAGSAALINKRSTTWRQLSQAEQQATTTADVVSLLQTYPTLLKRPVLTTGTTLLVGFKQQEWQQQLETVK
ncbi:Spx/MgsR family RNA polymerase-binding regulatory protein [Pseudidiomarina sp.]|uniref:Spx/MgsR family RNA polymerase-binding regulatory protein n=1 Tax=Pseudidiomarina sp. TaxID=2081707 RepID=UPI00299F0E93|nr:Spx/MgsR family RNA polymerase-binding regulatory protein [Pseudidiomarina sp.]MDX1705716.1 Spx/MgsR family RNA polymerase-binding regulatory protein [Pseudidiomarina sp.]